MAENLGLCSSCAMGSWVTINKLPVLSEPQFSDLLNESTTASTALSPVRLSTQKTVAMSGSWQGLSEEKHRDDNGSY